MLRQPCSLALMVELYNIISQMSREKCLKSQYLHGKKHFWGEKFEKT